MSKNYVCRYWSTILGDWQEHKAISRDHAVMICLDHAKFGGFCYPAMYLGSELIRLPLRSVDLW